MTLSVKAAIAAGYTSSVSTILLKSHTAHAETLAGGLSNPAIQPLFTNIAPNAMSADFKYVPVNNRIKINTAQTVHMTGLVCIDGMTPVPTTIWGYGDKSDGIITWPWRTFEHHVNDAPLVVKWRNNLIDPVTGQPLPHLLPVDTSIHWAYSLLGYEQYSIAQDGVPLVPHMHGGKNDSAFDGNPEFFFSPGNEIRGPPFR